MKIGKRTRKKLFRFLEFFLVGVGLGIFEDILAVKFATGEPITPKVILIVFLVALPFAFISEYVVDHPKFWKTMFRLKDDDKTIHPETDQSQPDKN